MILDYEMIFDENASLTAAYTSKSIDFGQKRPDLGMLKQFYAVVSIREAVTGTSFTITVEDSEDNSSFTPIVTTGAIKSADATGDIVVQIPTKHRRYLRVNIAPTSITAGTALIGITDNYDSPAWLYRDTVEFNTPDPEANVKAVNLASDKEVTGILAVKHGGTGKDSAG